MKGLHSRVCIDDSKNLKWAYVKEYTMMMDWEEIARFRYTDDAVRFANALAVRHIGMGHEFRSLLVES